MSLQGTPSDRLNGTLQLQDNVAFQRVKTQRVTSPSDKPICIFRPGLCQLIYTLAVGFNFQVNQTSKAFPA